MKVATVSFFLMAIIFLFIDIIWLSQAVGYFYEPNIGELLRDDPLISIAALFYLIYPLGVNLLVVVPALKEKSIQKAFFKAFVFGFVAYGTYNLTNMATLNGWSINVVIVDMIWGGVLTAVSAKLTIYLTQKLLAL